MTKQNNQPSLDEINESIYSAADLIAKIAGFTPVELNHYILNGNYVILKKTLDLKEMLPALPRGWRFQYISRMSNHRYKQLVILPTDKTRQRIWNAGLFTIASNAGLKDPIAAVVWAKWCNVSKFEYLPYLVKMLTDLNICEQYLDYEPKWSYNQYILWRERLGFDDQLKAIQRWDMIHMYQTIMRIKAEADQLQPESQYTATLGWSDRYSPDSHGRPVAVGFHSD